MIRQILAIGLAMLLLAPEANAVTVSVDRDAQKDVAVTIYNGNLGLVKDVRETRLATGTTEVQFGDVAALIDPTSVHLKSLAGAGLRILEQNYEYDLLSSQKLMEKYVGKRVRLYQPDGTYHEATLLSTAGPVFEINGQIHLGHNGRLVLPALPENLVSKPTLVWLITNQIAAAQKVEASYLTGGITWRADYVMVVNAADTRSDLTGWVTIDNKSGATYANASLKLVAGDINRAQDPKRNAQLMAVAARAASPDEARREFASEGFFEYHLYTLDGRTTIKDNQTKQLALMSAGDVPVEKHLVYYGAQEYYRNSYGTPISNQKVAVLLELRNSAANHLGAPLPKGKVRVYKADGSGAAQLIGEDWIDHTAKDERAKIKLGDTFDVVGERTQKEWRKIASGTWEVEWEISLRNHKQSDQTVRVIEPVPGDWQVLHATHKYEKPEAHTLTFDVPVPKDGATKVLYRVRIRV